MFSEIELTASFIPAESAVIGLSDKILTRVQTRESVSKVSSAVIFP